MCWFIFVEVLLVGSSGLVVFGIYVGIFFVLRGLYLLFIRIVGSILFGNVSF